MNRVKLRIFSPSESTTTRAVENRLPETDRPHILPFQSRDKPTVISGRFTAPAVRARLIRENSVCPECTFGDVQPLELEDSVISSRNHMPVPGTSTIVGFHCNNCGTEWPVYELTTRRNG